MPMNIKTIGVPVVQANEGQKHEKHRSKNPFKKLYSHMIQLLFQDSNEDHSEEGERLNPPSEGGGGTTLYRLYRA